MKIQQVFAAAALLFAIGLAGPVATAQGSEATIAALNNSPQTVECKVFWGNNQIAMEAISPSAKSEARVIPVSTGDRNLICKKQGVAAIPANVSPVVKFKSDVPGAYSITCSQNPDGTNFACSVLKPARS